MYLPQMRISALLGMISSNDNFCKLGHVDLQTGICGLKKSKYISGAVNIFESFAVSQAQWLKPVIQALVGVRGRQITSGQEFETSLANMEKPCLY